MTTIGPTLTRPNIPKQFDGRDPETEEPLLRFFRFAHLPDPLRQVSVIFYETALNVATLPRNAERTVALRKLLEAKDCAVRACLP